MKLALDPYMLRTTPLLALPGVEIERRTAGWSR